MPLLGNLLKKGIKIRESLEQEYSSPFDLQKNELRITARYIKILNIITGIVMVIFGIRLLIYAGGPV